MRDHSRLSTDCDRGFMVTADNVRARELDPLQWPCGNPCSSGTHKCHQPFACTWLELVLVHTSFWQGRKQDREEEQARTDDRVA